MLAIILKILGILGIILLILLAVVLLILFFPIGYCVNGVKNTRTTAVKIKVRWLFGLLRCGGVYPEPGRFIVKVLWFTLYDSNAVPVKKEGKVKKTKQKKSRGEQTETEGNAAKNQDHADGNVAGDKQDGTNPMEDVKETDPLQNEDAASPKEEKAEEKNAGTWKDKLFAKYEKIKYTIKKIYDKIKHILEEISFYKKLLQDEQTKLLFSHACKRIGKVLRHIRPRKLKVDVTFGASSPDTTGYIFAVYGMLSPKLGKDVCITPDFTGQILEGTLYAKGHITIFTILVNVCALILDKKLKLLDRRIKNHLKNKERYGS